MDCGTMHVVVAWLMVVVMMGTADLSSEAAGVKVEDADEHQVTSGRDTPLAWPAALTAAGRRRRSTAADDDDDEQFQFAVVVDAGSSGSRVRVYRWPTPAGGARVAVQAPGVEEVFNKKIEPGLSAHADDLTRVSEDIQTVLTDAAEHVPGPQQRSSPVYILATAGRLAVTFSRTLCSTPRPKLMFYKKSKAKNKDKDWDQGQGQGQVHCFLTSTRLENEEKSHHCRFNNQCLIPRKLRCTVLAVSLLSATCIPMSP